MPWSLAPLLHLFSHPLEPSSQTPQLPCPSQDHGPLPSSPKARPQCCPLPGLAYVGEMGWVPHAKPPPSQVAWGPAQPCQAAPLTSACPLPPAKTGPPGTACSLSCSPKFDVCGFLSAGPTPPRPTPPLSRPAPALPRPLEEWQENPGDPGAEDFPRLAAGPPVRATGNAAQGRQLVQSVCKLGLLLQDYEESCVILELPSPTLQTATHTDVQC